MPTKPFRCQGSERPFEDQVNSCGLPSSKSHRESDGLKTQVYKPKIC